MKKRVLIARCGGWKDSKAENGDYDNLIDLLSDQLKEYCNGNYSALHVIADIQVVNNKEEIIHELALRKPVHSIVFLTRGMIDFARELKEHSPNVNIVVFTGDYPENEIKLISKTWFLIPEEMGRIIIE